LAKFRLAVNDRISDKTLYIACTVFGKTAENVKSKLLKGVQVLIDGRLELDSVTGEDGKKRDFYGVVAEKLEINYAESEVLNQKTSKAV
jgi:single-stranded DNA-binding protein